MSITFLHVRLKIADMLTKLREMGSIEPWASKRQYFVVVHGSFKSSNGLVRKQSR